MTYLRLDTGFAVFASNNAGPANPDWYHNLHAHPRVTVEVGSQTIEVVARVAAGAERARIWSRQKEANPLFDEFERRTTRQIPGHRPRGDALTPTSVRASIAQDRSDSPANG